MQWKEKENVEKCEFGDKGTKQEVKTSEKGVFEEKSEFGKGSCAKNPKLGVWGERENKGG